MNSFDIWTDGSSEGRKDCAGGWCAVVISATGLAIAYMGFDPCTTNNRMELTAAIEGLETLGDSRAIVTVHTDSRYVQKPPTEGWLRTWQRNGWRSREGDPVANQDLWKRLLDVMSLHNIRWEHLRGHQNHKKDPNKYNHVADKLAVKAKKEQRGGMEFI